MDNDIETEEGLDEVEEFDYTDEDEDNDEDAQEELFRENPLKAIWIKLKEIEESILEDNENEESILEEDFEDVN